MGEGIRPPSWIDTMAYRLRNWPPVHRIGRWFRKTLWGSLVEGFWEFARHYFAKNPDFGPPLTTFSVYQALRCGWPKLNGRIVLHDQGVLCEPDSREPWFISAAHDDSCLRDTLAGFEVAIDTTLESLGKSRRMPA